jgi:protein-disulfide isomerase
MGDAGEAESVVNAVLFYSPTCPHCHTVIRDELPPLFEKYGDQFRVIYASTATDEGSRLYSEAADTLGFDRYVPVFVVGDQTFVGSGQLPEVLPDIIDEGIAAGGIDWPDLPLLEEVFDSIAANVDPLSE